MLRHLRSLGKALLLKTVDRRRLYVLNFHVIGFNGTGTTTTLEHFEQALDWLNEHCRLVALQDWIVEPHSIPSVAITFDDGHRSVVDFALPMLRARGIPTTLFINTGYWDRPSRGCWSDGTITDMSVAGEDITPLVSRARNSNDPKEYRHLTDMIEDALTARLVKQPDPYLSRDEVFALDDPLVAIGLHGHWHHRHAMFDPAWEEKNIAECHNILAQHPQFVPIFAAPFGKAHDLTPHTAKLCHSMGLRLALHDGGYVLPNADVIRRIPSDQRDVEVLIHGASPIGSRQAILPTRAS